LTKPRARGADVQRGALVEARQTARFGKRNPAYTLPESGSSDNSFIVDPKNRSYD
jgi:hypothetical protein